MGYEMRQDRHRLAPAVDQEEFKEETGDDDEDEEAGDDYDRQDPAQKK